jgi:protease I
MPSSLNDKAIAFLVAPEGAEQVERTEPRKAVEQAGGTPELVSTEVCKVRAFNHLTPADTFEADKSADSVSSSDYALWFCPAASPIPTFCALTTRLPALCNTPVGAFAKDKT